MFATDPISIQFEIPATDHLGRDHVEGKIRFMADEVEIGWRIRGNVFRGRNADVEMITMPYGQIEHVELRKKWWKIRDIILRIADPSLVAMIPGVEMGKMILQIDQRSREEAEKLESLIDYKRSIFILDEQTKRLEKLKES
jgi:hypothetical protein